MGDQEVRDAQNVADILVDPNGDRIRDHWDRTAHSLLVGVMLHVLYAEREKTLAGCARFLARPDRPIDTALEVIDPDSGVATLTQTLEVEESSGGCCQASGQDTSFFVLGLPVLLVLRRRRRA